MRGSNFDEFSVLIFFSDLNVSRRSAFPSSNPSIDSLMTTFNKVTIPDVPSALSDQAEDSADDVRVDSEMQSQKRSVLNFSQLRVIEIRQGFKLTRGTTNGILEMIQDARFDPSELGTTKVQRLERSLREYGGKVTEYDFLNPEDGKQDLKMYFLCIRQVAAILLLRERLS